MGQSPPRLEGRTLRTISTFLLALAIAFTASCSARKLVLEHDRAELRDPESGLTLGSQPRTLGPADSNHAVLLIHGFLGNGSNYADLPARLAAKGWRVRVLRLPGHGTTPTELETTTAEDYLTAVHNEFEALKSAHEIVAVVGHSLGGTLATLLASDAPVDCLVLAAPYYSTNQPWYSPLPVSTALNFADSHMEWFYKGDLFKQINRTEGKPDVASYSWVPVKGLLVAEELTALAIADGVPESVHAPALWLHSRNDKAASFDSAQKVIHRMPGATTYLDLPRTNHIVFFDWDREMAKAAVVNYLQNFLSQGK